MGWENVFHCEWNPFGQKVLKHYWPHSISYNDITKTDFSIHRGEIDIITGGFPCQPYSAAGKRLGKEDSRHLWPEMLRAIREISPSWVVGENVRGLTNWNGGMVFDEVCTDLENLGYQIAPFLIPACATNAQHKRERIWFIANAKSARAGENIGGVWSEFDRCCEGIQETRITTNSRLQRQEKRQQHSMGIKQLCSEQNATNPSSNGYEIGCEEARREIRSCEQGGMQQFEGMGSERVTSDTNGIRLRGKGNRIGKSGFFSEKSKINNWQNFPTVSPVCNGDDGFSNRLDSITFSKWRNESIKAGGNAVVPQVVYQIFKAIEAYEAS